MPVLRRVPALFGSGLTRGVILARINVAAFVCQNGDHKVMVKGSVRCARHLKVFFYRQELSSNKSYLCVSMILEICGGFSLSFVPSRSANALALITLASDMSFFVLRPYRR